MSLPDNLTTIGEGLAVLGVSLSGAASISLSLFVLGAYEIVAGSSTVLGIPSDIYYQLFISLIILGAGLAGVGVLINYIVDQETDNL